MSKDSGEPQIFRNFRKKGIQKFYDLMKKTQSEIQMEREYRIYARRLDSQATSGN